MGGSGPKRSFRKPSASARNKAVSRRYFTALAVECGAVHLPQPWGVLRVIRVT